MIPRPINFNLDAEKLVWDEIIVRIEQHDWDGKIDNLPEPDQTVIYVCSFYNYFGNGGIRYFFETDPHGIAICSKLDTIGMKELADCVRNSFHQLFSKPELYKNYDSRTDILDEKEELLESLEKPMWNYFDQIIPQLGFWIKNNSSSFEKLNNRLKYENGRGYYE